ncbi:MAG: RNA polymerase sigma factor [Solirubrobacteraceae bacterium]
MYDAHYGAVLAYALRRTANAEDAGDVVSEVFLTAWRRIDAVPGGEAARLWLYGTARRVIANQTRAMRRQKRLSERLGREPSHSPLAGDTAEPGAASAAFAALSAEDRDLLGLVAWEGLSHREVAAVLGCSVNAAKLRAHRARRRFAASLAERGATRPRRTSLRASDPQVAQAPAEG